MSETAGTTDPSAGPDSDPSEGSETGTTPGGDCETKDDCSSIETPDCCDAIDAELFGCEPEVCWFNPENCGDFELEEVLSVPPNVMLVLDKSGSMFNMDNFWDHDLDDMDDDGLQDADMMTPATPKQSRWKSLHEVVTLIGNSFDSSMNLGAQLFPSKDGVAVLGPQACVVENTPEAPVAGMNAATILSVIPPAGDLSGEGGTPAEKGMTSAIAHLNGLMKADNQSNRIILITDGAANCSVSAMDDAELLDYDQNLIPTISAAASQAAPDEVYTYVVGVDIKDEVDANGINPFQVLNEAAVAGGVPKDDPVEKFYNATNQIELQAALDLIIGQVLSCDIVIDGVPDMTKPVIAVNGIIYEDPITQAECDAMMDGWTWLDDEMTQIRLCGSACSNYQVSGTLDLKFVCDLEG